MSVQHSECKNEGVGVVVLIALFALGVLLPGKGLAVDDYFPSSISRVVHEAAVIARVKVVSRTPVWEGGLVAPNDRLASQHICGYLYNAEVVESFKGGGDKFSFFSAVDEDFQGYERDYLVFSYERDPDEERRIVERLSSRLMTEKQAAQADLVCKSFGKYYVPISEQMMFPFDPEATKLFGGEWISNFNRETMVFCYGAPTGDWVEKLKNNNDKRSAVIEWKGIRKMIQTAMKNRYKFWLNEVERMGGC